MKNFLKKSTFFRQWNTSEYKYTIIKYKYGVFVYDMCIIICICRWYMFVVILFAILDAESAVNSVLSAFYAHLEIWKSSHIFAQEWLKTMCMTPQKTIYITVYLLLLIPTLSIALVTRIFSLKVMLLDGFSGNIIFLITCILCAVLYLIFKTSIDGYILPILCKCSKIQLAVAESVTKEVTKSN